MAARQPPLSDTPCRVCDGEGVLNITVANSDMPPALVPAPARCQTCGGRGSIKEPPQHCPWCRAERTNHSSSLTGIYECGALGAVTEDGERKITCYGYPVLDRIGILRGDRTCPRIADDLEAVILDRAAEQGYSERLYAFLMEDVDGETVNLLSGVRERAAEERKAARKERARRLWAYRLSQQQGARSRW